jgi:hypothetical protein
MHTKMHLQKYHTRTYVVAREDARGSSSTVAREDACCSYDPNRAYTEQKCPS